MRRQTLQSIPPQRGWRFATKLQLAARLVEWIAPLLKEAGKSIWLVVDGGYVKRPFLRRAMAAGTTVVGSGYGENDGSFSIRVAGNGSGSQVLSAANEFTSLHSTNVAHVWRNTSAPKAQALFVNCVGGGVNQRQFDIPDVYA